MMQVQSCRRELNHCARCFPYAGMPIQVSQFAAWRIVTASPTRSSVLSSSAGSSSPAGVIQLGRWLFAATLSTQARSATTFAERSKCTQGAANVEMELKEETWESL